MIHPEPEPEPGTATPGGPMVSDHAASVGFLISQISFSAGRSLHGRLAPFDLETRHFGLLRMVAAVEGECQQVIAGLLQIPPSRLVVLVDELEARGLVERRPNPADRRAHALVLTDAGRRVLTATLAVADAHESELTEPLTADERLQLIALLDRIATHRGLLPGIHPGLRDTAPAGPTPDHWASRRGRLPERSEPPARSGQSAPERERERT